MTTVYDRLNAFPLSTLKDYCAVWDIKPLSTDRKVYYISAIIRDSYRLGMTPKGIVNDLEEFCATW